MTPARQGQAIRIRGQSPLLRPLAMNSWRRWLRRSIRRFAAPHAATGIRRRARNRTAPFPTVAGRVRADNTGAFVHQIHRFRRIPWRAAVSDLEKANPKQTLLSARHGLSAGWSVCFFDIVYAVMPAGRIRPAPLGFATFSAPARTCRNR